MKDNWREAKENPSETILPGAGATFESQLSAYEVTAKATDQIIALQADLSKLTNLFFVITSTLWAAIATEKFGISDPVALGLLVFHLIASVLTLQVIATTLNGMRLRFEFLSEFRPKFHWHIEKLGESGWQKTYGNKHTFRARYLRWGNPPKWLWLFVPSAGFCGSFFGSIYYVWRIVS